MSEIERETEVEIITREIQSEIITVALQGPPGSGLNPLIQGYREKVLDHGEVSGAMEIDFRAANIHVLTVAGPLAPRVVNWPEAPGTAGRLTLYVAMPEAFAINWPPEVDWGESGAPAFAVGRMAAVVLTTLDGGATILGFLAGTGFLP